MNGFEDLVYGEDITRETKLHASIREISAFKFLLLKLL